MDCRDHLAWTYVCDPGPEIGMTIAPGMQPGSFSNSVSLRAAEVVREADQGAAARLHLGTWGS